MNSKEVFRLYDEWFSKVPGALKFAASASGGVTECHNWLKSTYGSDIAKTWLDRISKGPL